MSLHVGVPPEAAAAGLRKPKQVHGLFLWVSSISCVQLTEHVSAVLHSLFSLPVSSKVTSWSCSGDVLVSPDPPTCSPDVYKKITAVYCQTWKLFFRFLLFCLLQGPSECTTTSSTMNTSATENTSTWTPHSGRHSLTSPSGWVEKVNWDPPPNIHLHTCPTIHDDADGRKCSSWNI